MDLQPLATQLNRTEDHYLPSSHPFCVSHRYIEVIYGTPSDHREDIFTLIPYHPPSQWMELHPQTCDSLFTGSCSSTLTLFLRALPTLGVNTTILLMVDSLNTSLYYILNPSYLSLISRDTFYLRPAVGISGRHSER